MSPMSDKVLSIIIGFSLGVQIFRLFIAWYLTRLPENLCDFCEWGRVRPKTQRTEVLLTIFNLFLLAVVVAVAAT